MTPSELEDRLAALRPRLGVTWDEARDRRVEKQMYARRQARAQRRTLVATAGATLALCAVLGSALWWRGRTSPASWVSASLPSTELSANLFRFPDGSTVQLTTPDSRVAVYPATPDRFLTVLRSGGARFSVAKHPTRKFRVEANRVSIEVLGTKFSVEQADSELAHVRVAVAEGRVRVMWQESERVLQTGQEGIFPPDEAGQKLALERRQATIPPSTDAPDSPPTTLPPKAPPAPRLPPAIAAPIAPARDSVPSPTTTTVDQVGVLLAQADTARKAAKWDEAVAILEKIVAEHPGDLRASLAAFTLGRVELESRRQFVKAAEAFAKARSLSPDGPLAEDALAREVEAWAKAGNVERAKVSAREYLEKFPTGHRRDWVDRFSE